MPDCLDFACRLLRIPSLPGQEAELAAVVREELVRLGFDRVWCDDAGNVCGLIRGQGTAPSLMFNSHLDHVDPGDPSRWPAPPYAAEVRDGRLIGRGAVDIKGPLAAQMYGLARLIRSGRKPPGDVFMTAVVQEEVGGLGARHLARENRFGCVIIGEPSSCQLRRGHRGRIELQVTACGLSCHASVPEQGVNALNLLSRFILALPTVPRLSHPELGSESVAPTLISTDQSSPNVIPGAAVLTLDWRSIPGEGRESVVSRLQASAEACALPGGSIGVEAKVQTLTSYTGFSACLPVGHPAYVLPQDHPAVRAAERILEDVLAGPAVTGIWRFATDGGYFAEAGMTVLGFGPGDPLAAHTAGEAIALAELEKAEAAYAALADGLAVQLS